ncbi:MAG: serine/threonine protein kinase [Gammaproteobacteria bacterium]
MLQSPVPDTDDTLARSDEALPPGTILERYVIRSVLGRGSFGITYLATERRLERYVAIKEYLPRDFASRRADSTVVPNSGEDAEFFRYGLDRMLGEAKTIIQFDHSHIVKVLTYFEINGTAYIVMQYEEGTNLGEHLRSHCPLTEKQLLNIVCPINRGLSLIHGAGVIHRDIKPDNIYLRKDNSPVLIDFGAARNVFKTKGDQLTRILTPGYAPFEQEAPTWAAQGPWTDIYALGATLYFAVTGQRAPNANSRVGVLENVQQDSYTPLQSQPDNKYSMPFLRAIDWALEFRPDDRPQTIDDWDQALTGASAPDMSVLRLPAATSTSATRLSTNAPNTSASAVLAEQAESHAQKIRKPWTALAIAAGMLTIAALSTALLLDGTDPVVETTSPPTPVVGIGNFVKPALIVAKSSGEKHLVARKNSKLIEDVKVLEETPDRKRFITDLSLKQAEARNAFEVGMQEYAEMVTQLRTFPPGEVQNAIRLVLAEPAFNSDRAHAAIGELLVDHVTDVNSEVSAWKQDIKKLSETPQTFARE